MGEEVWWPRTQWLPSRAAKSLGRNFFLKSISWEAGAGNHIKKLAFVAALFTDIYRVALSDAGLNVLRNLAKAVTLVHQVTSDPVALFRTSVHACLDEPSCVLNRGCLHAID